MTCVISDAGTVTLLEYLSSLLVFSELGNKSNMTCVISDAGTVTLPEYLSSLMDWVVQTLFILKCQLKLN